MTTIISSWPATSFNRLSKKNWKNSKISNAHAPDPHWTSDNAQRSMDSKHVQAFQFVSKVSVWSNAWHTRQRLITLRSMFKSLTFVTRVSQLKKESPAGRAWIFQTLPAGGSFKPPWNVENICQNNVSSKVFSSSSCAAFCHVPRL